MTVLIFFFLLFFLFHTAQIPQEKPALLAQHIRALLGTYQHEPRTLSSKL